jgi:hypothetical protein
MTTLWNFEVMLVPLCEEFCNFVPYHTSASHLTFAENKMNVGVLLFPELLVQLIAPTFHIRRTPMSSA